MSEVMSRPAPRTLVLNAADNIAVALSNLDVGAETPEGIRTVKRVPRGPQIRAEPIRSGEAVVKFGQIIGFATKDIPVGDWVHEHNCGVGEEHGAFKRDYAFGEGVVPTQLVPKSEQATFQGYRRANGKAGTRNYLGILTSVNCSATVAKFLSPKRSTAPASSTTIPRSMASCRSFMARAAMRTRARRSRFCSARNGATPPIPISAGALLVGLGCRPSRSTR